jgi:hypothetical protein
MDFDNTNDPFALSRKRTREMRERIQDMNNPAAPEYQELTERARQARMERRAIINAATAPYDAKRDYYRALREKYNSLPALSDTDYNFLEAIRPVIETAPDPEEARDQILAAAFYANVLDVPIDSALQNLDEFHKQWTGKTFVKKTGIQAVIDSLGVSFLAQKQNALAIKYHNSGQDPEVLKELEEVNRQIDRLRDSVPKIWSDEYVKQGGMADVGAFFRSITTGAAENAVPIGIGIGAGALAATGVGAIAGATGLAPWLSGILVTGAGMAATAETTAFSTVGTEYFDLVSQGIPDDIAWTNANISAQIQGAIEAVGGGVVSKTTKEIIRAAAPKAITKAVSRWFIKGKMSLGAKAFLDYLKEGAGEALEEGAQQAVSIAFFNKSAEESNERRSELVRRIYDEPLENIRAELVKELERYPEISGKEFDEAWKEIKEAAMGGIGTALILGVPGAAIGYRNNVKAASILADMAKDAPNAEAFVEEVRAAKEKGFEVSVTENMTTEDETALLSDIYKVQQERMTPEEREARQRAAIEAEAIAEVTDYGNTDVEDVPELNDEGKPTGNTFLELVTNAESDIYREEGRLEISEYIDEGGEGAIEGRFVAGDPRKPEADGNQYGYINYTEKDGAVTIDEFKMIAGYENLRGDLYRQFAEAHAGQNIVWNPKNEGNTALREKIAADNPRGPAYGLNYFENTEQFPASAEARQVARRFAPYLKNATPLETALAVETFGAFYRRRGESLDGAMSRLFDRVTNEAPDAVAAAQRTGKTIKGATWVEQTAEGVKRIIYVSKNAADGSTVIHEISHAVAADFTEAERNIAARALNGYRLKNGARVGFKENAVWGEEQQEAFAEALENYLTNGTAPNEEIKGLFERIKEFMGRIYRTMKGWTELSPQAETFYQSLLSGELAGQARAENVSRTDEDGHGTARPEKTNNTAENETARLREAVITSPDISLETKGRAVFDAAGAVLTRKAYRIGTGDGSHNYVIFDDRVIGEPKLLFQTGDRDIMEEAAGFDSPEEWRQFIELFEPENPFGKFQEQVEGMSPEDIDAWIRAFWENARKATQSAENAVAVNDTESLTPAERDAEFIEIISEPATLDKFLEAVKQSNNEDYARWQAEDEEDAAERDRQREISDKVRKAMTHPMWETFFIKKGEITDGHKKRLLGLIRNYPREYRAIYAEVMNRPDLAVSAGDATAAILKHRIADSRKVNIDSLTPEKLSQLAEQLDLEEYAEKVRTGKAKYNDEIERKYIKQLEERRQEAEKALREAEADREGDNRFIEREAGKQFTATFERALKAREEMAAVNGKLDRAIKNRLKDAGRIARQAVRSKATYDGIMETLDALARAHQLEIDVREALSDAKLKDYAKSAKTEATLLARLARKAAAAETRARLAEIKEKHDTLKALSDAKRKVTKRILRPANPREVNADQGRAIAVIQRLAEPSLLEGIDRFIGGIEKPYLRGIFETWKTDELIRVGILRGQTKAAREKISRLFAKNKFDDLTNEEKKYLYRKIPPKDWAAALGLNDIIERRNLAFPMTNAETEQQIAFKYLPSDVYYRLMDKPFSEWTLSEGEELAKIIDNLTVQGKEIYKANLDAEKKRIREYQDAIKETLGALPRWKRELLADSGDTPEEKARKQAEAEKIIGKYKDGRKAPSYADIGIRRYARMLDNGDPEGKNSAVLVRRKDDAYNQKMAAIDARTERVQKRMEELGIKEGELWKTVTEIDLGKDLGKTPFTAAKLIGIISASRNDFSREAVIYGNLLSEAERGKYQYDGITGAELAPLLALAEERYVRVMEAAEKLMAEKPRYRELMETIDEDFIINGRRVNEALVRYNNTFMPIEEFYFPMNRQNPVTARSADADLKRDLMGGSSGAFNLFVEKGFTKRRENIPPQYQTAIDLDILSVFTRAVNREEHFMAYGQLVKDLNRIYKDSRQVRDAIQRRYGRGAVKYVDSYINTLANPESEKIRTSLDKTIRSIRGHTAAAYLGWKISSIVKQAITSPAPFFAYLNPLEYTAAMLDFSTHYTERWGEIQALSEQMKHRSANLLIDIVKKNAGREGMNKVDEAISKFINEKGMIGLELVDRFCVAPGWYALFKKRYKSLTNDPNSANMTEKDRRVKAARYADNITNLVQPNANPEELPPMFREGTELTKALLQFQSALSPIWQNFRYDLPQMIHDRRIWNAAGTVIGYTLAGIMLGAITLGFDDDDDEKARAAKLAFWAATSFTDAFPVIGAEVTQFAEAIITGGRTSYRGGINLFPTLWKIRDASINAAQGIREGEFKKLLKAAAAAVEAAGMAKGLPVSGIKEAGRVTGIGDGDGKPDFNPGALWGKK